MTRTEAKLGVGQDAQLADGDDETLAAAVLGVLCDGRTQHPRWAPRDLFGALAGGAELVQPWAYAWRAERALAARGIHGCAVSIRLDHPRDGFVLTCIDPTTPAESPTDSTPYLVLAYSAESREMWTTGIPALVSAVESKRRRAVTPPDSGSPAPRA